MTPSRAAAGMTLAMTLAGTALAGPAEVASPLEAAAAHPAGATTLTFNAAAYERLRHPRDVVLTGFRLDAVTVVDLVVERFEVFTPNARIVRSGADGDVDMPRPDVVLLRGTVAGFPDSSVFLGLSPHGSNGVIEVAGARYVIATRQGPQPGATVIYDVDAMAPDALNLRPFSCGTDLLPAVEPEFAAVNRAPGVAAAGPEFAAVNRAPRAAAAGGEPPGICTSVVEIAVETDWEFTNDLFEGDTEASSAYATQLMGAASAIYARDAGAAIQVPFLRVWADPNDLWMATNIFGQLVEFRDYWDLNMTGVSRHAAHFLSGRNLSGAGGVAYLPGLCRASLAYGLSAHLNGYFPFPTEDNDPQNWDLVVVCHELGHNFGASHTHDVNPPIDECAFGDCTGADQGTIMSYCHTCDGGISNIKLFFHERTLTEGILPFLAEGLSCPLSSAGLEIINQPADALACPGENVTFTVTASGVGSLEYQWRFNSNDIFGETSPSYTQFVEDGAAAGLYDVVVTSDCGSITSEAATLTVGTCCTTDLPQITGHPVGGAVCTGSTITLSVTASGPGPLDYQWRVNGTNIVGATGPTHVLFNVIVAHSGLYDVIVSNTCGSVTSASANLQVLFCGPPCPWDLNGDIQVDTIDFFLLIAFWGQNPGGPPDFNLDGTVDTADFFDLIGHWGQCPL